MAMSRHVMALAAAVALATASLTATEVVPTPFRTVVSGAALIIRGHITEVRSVVVPGAGIESVGTVAVDAVLKGQSDAFVSIWVPGGQVGRERFVMIGAPRLRTGQQALFFLERGPDNRLRPVGLSMGIFTIYAASGTGQPVVNPPLVVGRTASAGTVVRGDVRRQSMAVPEFEALVRLVMAGQQPGRRVRR
jgi:hypothetical protein